MPKCLHARNTSRLAERSERFQDTSGGSSETGTNELMVRPMGAPPRRTRRDDADPGRELAQLVAQCPVREDWIPHLRLASRRARTRFLPAFGIAQIAAHRPCAAR